MTLHARSRRTSRNQGNCLRIGSNEKGRHELGMCKGVYDLIGIADSAMRRVPESSMLNIAQEVGRVLCAYRREVGEASESRVSVSCTRPSS
jgi:hypothetical protein